MKHALDVINDRLDIAEKHISKLEQVTIETIQNKMEKKEFLKVKRVSELWYNFRQPNINTNVTGIPEKRRD